MMIDAELCSAVQPKREKRPQGNWLWAKVLDQGHIVYR
jgi:hypothetical protein